MTVFSLVVALADNGVIGRAGGLPWRLPADLRHFKSLTVGKTVLMGRKTWTSLGRPLPDRQNWILTRDPSFSASGGTVFGTLGQATQAANQAEITELMVIGGAEIYAQTLPIAQRLYLTRVHDIVAGDTYFPEWDERGFEERSREDHPADERHAHAFSFITLERRVGVL